MNRLARGIAALMLVAVLGISHDATPEKPPCPSVMVALESDIDSGQAKANDSFAFVTVDAVRLLDGTLVPANTLGYGLVAIAHHAERGGLGGSLVLEARFVALGDRHIPASIDWSTAGRAMASGASMNVPGIVGAIPFSGYLLAPYGYLHHGKDIMIPRGRGFPVLLGDEVATGACRVVAPTPEPSTTPSNAPSMAPSSTPAPVQAPSGSPAP